MKRILKLLRQYPLTYICLVLICYLSIFFRPPKTPLDGVAFIDKWTHIVMYGGTCAVFWWEYLRNHHYQATMHTFFLGWLPFVIASGVIELIQEYLTTNRAGEWLDLLANATGATLGTLIGVAIKKNYGVKKVRNGKEL